MCPSVPRSVPRAACKAHRALLLRFSLAMRTTRYVNRGMDEWQKERVRRAIDQDIYCTEVVCTDDGFVFTIVGTTGEEYLAEIHEDAGEWCQKSCSCNDSYWRPYLNCKHLVHCLRMMGVSEDALEDASWEPNQDELFEYLCRAPDILERVDDETHRDHLQENTTAPFNDADYR